ncbi:hypothetical protein CB0940_00525 [Cercospora beticola]|uniref:Hydroxysteroid dehydrogenase-like protein 2 n=1 Tax=Cercospora beticola TaxID=122368 RepID=A0A2G5I9A7_CERBT|nr:hypothetical protein CB0940_00525 [Cercospora beticola]PIB01094.1 hypothetical protein CB0940_00525 [Cercospora beticola]WPA95944.1 hypothetical protein RHO25_000548 [Cercospora beticola]
MAPNQPVALVIGASRGIGRQVAIDLAKNGYAVIVSAKSTSSPSSNAPFPPDPNSSDSTITTVAREISNLGHESLAIACDNRFPDQIQTLITKSFAWKQRLDVVVYNSGAIWWSSVDKTDLKRFQLMQKINPEGLYAVVQEVLKVWNDGKDNAHRRIVVVSPPIYSRFVKGKTAYAMGKFGMSTLTMGLAVDFERQGKSNMAITSIWPAAAIDSAATQANRTREARSALRKPEIFSDAILAIIRSPAKDVNGKLVLDEDFLRDHEGVTNFDKYALVQGTEPRRIMPRKMPDLSVEEQDDEGVRVDSTEIRKDRGAKL